MEKNIIAMVTISLSIILASCATRTDTLANYNTAASYNTDYAYLGKIYPGSVGGASYGSDFGQGYGLNYGITDYQYGYGVDDYGSAYGIVDYGNKHGYLPDYFQGWRNVPVLYGHGGNWHGVRHSSGGARSVRVVPR